MVWYMILYEVNMVSGGFQKLQPFNIAYYMRPSWNRHLTVVEGFGCPNDPRSYVVGGYMPLVGSPKANWS